MQSILDVSQASYRSVCPPFVHTLSFPLSHRPISIFVFPSPPLCVLPLDKTVSWGGGGLLASWAFLLNASLTCHVTNGPGFARLCTLDVILLDSLHSFSELDESGFFSNVGRCWVSTRGRALHAGRSKK